MWVVVSLKEMDPQGLKPQRYCKVDVRAEARTLQEANKVDLRTEAGTLQEANKVDLRTEAGTLQEALTLQTDPLPAMREVVSLSVPILSERHTNYGFFSPNPKIFCKKFRLSP